MPIQHNEGGSTTITGDSISFFQLAARKGAVSLEMQGMKRRGEPAWKICRDAYSIPGTGKRRASMQQVYDWLCAKVEELRPQQQHVFKETP